jgi:hypothetical protein
MHATLFWTYSIARDCINSILCSSSVRPNTVLTSQLTISTQCRGSVVLEDGKILFFFRSGFRWRHVIVLPGADVAEGESTAWLNEHFSQYMHCLSRSMYISYFCWSFTLAEDPSNHRRRCFYAWHSITPEAFQPGLQATHERVTIETYPLFDRRVAGLNLCVAT